MIYWGATRMVILTGKWAFKMPSIASWRLFLHGLLANMQEVVLSRSKLPGFCPVRYSLPGGWLLIMHRARPLTDTEFSEFDYSAWTDRGNYVIPVENKISSFGVWNGEVVAVDYGN